MRALGLCTIALFASAGCGEDGGPGDADAGIDDPDGGFFPDAPEPPAAPAMPVLTPCPDGWREAADATGVVACEPWPSAGSVDCDDDEAWFPGTSGCAPIGPACPAGDFADGLPASGVIYVRAGAIGGDGSAAAPFGTIAEGIAAAGSGDVVALSKGTFDEAVRISSAIVLRGACVAETVIACSTFAAATATVTLTGAGGSTLRDLTVSGLRFGIDVFANTEAVTIESVVVSGTRASGLSVFDGGRLVAHGIAIRETDPDDLGRYGNGLEVFRSGTALLERVFVFGNANAGVHVADAGSTLDATDLAVLDTEAQAVDGLWGNGVSISGGALVTLHRAWLDGNRTAAVVVEGPSELVATDLAIQGTRVRKDDGVAGVGISSALGARVEIHRALLADGGIIAQGVDLASEDLVVRDCRADDAGRFGYGLELADGAAGTLTRSAIVRCRTIGILVTGEGTHLGAEDLVVAGTAIGFGDEDGMGLLSQGGAEVDVTRARIVGSHSGGVVALDQGRIALTDVEVADTDPAPTGFGFGYGLQLSGAATLTRVTSRANSSAGILVQDGMVDGTDVVISDTRPARDTTGGDGLATIDGASVDLERVLCDGNRRAGIVADLESHLVFRQLAATHTREQACVDDVCPRLGMGTGITAIRGAHVEVTGLRASDNALCGVQIAGGEMDLHGGEVSGNPIGANVQGDFDLTRLQDGVAYRDNEVTLDATALPVPETATALDR